ncbi:MAG TPA: NAD(+)/NADH kinase [Balneolales bacterium]|nr:NAD(+)/NADH kinase [Balneolales bacterium]
MKLAVIANPAKYEIKEPFKKLLHWASQNQVDVYFHTELKYMLDEMCQKCCHPLDSELKVIDEAQIIIAMGGDGTMLRTARLVGSSGKPILGVNSGRLGFMANTQPGQLIEALKHIMSGNFKLDKRYLLEAVDNGGNHYLALNEILFSKKASASMITISAYYNGMFINRYWADGLLVSSPTGSTAYNLSSGGPIVMPQTNVLVLTPINPHTLTTRPVVLPTDEPIRLAVEKQEHDVLFSYDGEICEITQYPLEVEINRTSFTIDILELPGHDYFETLRTKLMWGRDFRDKALIRDNL